MGRHPGKLTALAAARASKPGMYGDGGGLYLQVAPSGVRSWIFRFQLNGRRRDMGLASLADVSLALARQKAADARSLLSAGHDPIEVKRSRAAALAAEAAKSVTFESCAEAYIESHRAGWRNSKHAA